MAGRARQRRALTRTFPWSGTERKAWGGAGAPALVTVGLAGGARGPHPGSPPVGQGCQDGNRMAGADLLVALRVLGPALGAARPPPPAHITPQRRPTGTPWGWKPLVLTPPFTGTKEQSQADGQACETQHKA